MEIEVQLYGRLAEYAGRRLSVAVPAGGCTIGDLRLLIARLHPRMADAMAAPKARACVDDTMVPESFRIAPGQAVEYFPPVSGG